MVMSVVRGIDFCCALGLELLPASTIRSCRHLPPVLCRYRRQDRATVAGSIQIVLIATRHVLGGLFAVWHGWDRIHLSTAAPHTAWC